MAGIEYIDATKLADFQRCPQLYAYKHVDGYVSSGESADILFGSLFGEALELFEKELFDGKTHEAAHANALAHVLGNATNSDGTHKFGSYVRTWRCLGTTPYKNDKGNAAKCPYSHKGRYFPAPAPEICSCGSQVDLVLLWVPTKATKDITSLVELLVGYTDGARSRHLIPIKINDKPAIELFWQIEFGQGKLARPVILCGNLDAIKAFGTENYVTDYKTTAKSLDARYWQGFSPNVQVDLYNAAVGKALPDLDIRGVAIEAFSTANHTSAFKIITATDEQKEEMLEDTTYWIKQLQACEDTNIWPRNRTGCFLCQFQPICSRPPEIRTKLLGEKFKRAKWNPQARTMELIGTASPSTSEPPIQLKLSAGSTEFSKQESLPMPSMTVT